MKFDVKSKRLDVYIDFKKGSTFSYENIETKEETIDGQKSKIEISRENFNNLKAYDTKNKSWRHLNFFEHYNVPRKNN